VRVVSPDAAGLAELVARAGGQVTPAPAPADATTFTVAGLESARIGDLAGELGLRLHELTPRSASLEEAFMELTHDSVDHRPAGIA